MFLFSKSFDNNLIKKFNYFAFYNKNETKNFVTKYLFFNVKKILYPQKKKTFLIEPKLKTIRISTPYKNLKFAHFLVSYSFSYKNFKILINNKLN